MNIIIMAGGGGTRLWPLSRKNNPKQFLDLGTGKTLLEHTYDRATQLADRSHIFVAITEEYRDKVSTILKDIPEENMFFEPERRDTAPAFAACAVQLELLGKGNEPTLFMWSDHVFTNEDAFLSALKKAPLLLTENPESIVIVGHTAISPETGLGYIEVGDRLENYEDVYHVASFKEKPDLETAKKYVGSGSYFWNMAYISVRPSYLLSELRKYEPELMQGIDVFTEAVKTHDQEAANSAYAKLPKRAIDYALLEKADSILVTTGDFGWSDVGNWAAVQEIFGLDGDHMPHGHHIHVDSSDNYIYNATNKAVSLVGMKDTIVVVTEDAVLCTPKSQAAKVKEVVAKLEEEDKSEYL